MTLELFHHPKDRLRLTVDDEKSYVTVKPAWASPLTYPNHYLALLDGKGEEIVTITDPETELGPESLRAVLSELERRYLTATIHTIEAAKTEFGATYWDVITEKGKRDFVTQSLQENVQWLSPVHLLLIDVDGNRFEIKDRTKLDARSQQILEAIV